jgi:hypothetical protein
MYFNFIFRRIKIMPKKMYVAYEADNVFPLTQAYEFAQKTDDVEVSKKSRVIKETGSIPKELEQYGGTSQARRVFMYLLFLKHRRWNEFEGKCWFGNEGDKYRIINDLMIYFIDSGRLVKYKDTLPTEIRDLIPWQDS